MVEFVNTRVPELPVYSLSRVGGTLERLKQLVNAGYPVIIEAGYDPEPDRLGWMGHYLLVIGYDDAVQEFVTHDSYIGSGTRYSYEHIRTFWQHFNYTYIVLYESGSEPDLLALLGEDADPTENTINALEMATAEASANREDAFAWFNMGTNFTALGLYDRAVVAYDEARRIGLPWRMLWYQFGPLEAYYNQGRYDDLLTLVNNNLNDGGGHFIEETHYYKALARFGQGDIARTLENLREAVRFNPNFTP
ncbi:MAG: C39 family peptidase, partial [Anaerolineae bacterium]|nr:C39 family peptidase [Anaerolineae bacterium]